MRFVVYGAGAIGGLIGGRLFESGQDVVLIARGAHGTAIAERGLLIEDPDRAVTLPVPVVVRPSEVAFGPDDVVILATKTQDTAAAVEALAAVAPPSLRVVCAQNGVENERLVSERFATVMAMCVMCPATHLTPGIIEAGSAPVPGILDVGRYPSGVDGTVVELAAALRGATFASEPRPDIMRWKYAKLLMNLLNAVEATCGFGPGSGDVIDRIRAEGLAALAAAGIDHVPESEDRERRGDLITLRPVGGRRRGGGSSWQSIRRGAGSVEARFLNGEVVRLGRDHGVPTPANEVIIEVAEELAHRGGEPGSVDPELIVGLIDARS